MEKEGIEMEGKEEMEFMKVAKLQPRMGNVNIIVKIIDLGEEREVKTRMGDSRRLREARVADDTGSILMTLWDDQGNKYKENDTIKIVNGYISLVRGHMRLGLGRYGNFEETEEALEEVASEPDMSEKEFDTGGYGYRKRSYQGGYGGEGRGSGRYYNRRDSHREHTRRNYGE